MPEASAGAFNHARNTSVRESSILIVSGSIFVINLSWTLVGRPLFATWEWFRGFLHRSSATGESVDSTTSSPRVHTAGNGDEFETFMGAELFGRFSSDCEVYVSQMMLTRLGYPLWRPTPDENLPMPYRAHGLSIGDFGCINDDGGFDYFFNALYDETHARQSTIIPPNFDPWPQPANSIRSERPRGNCGDVCKGSGINLTKDFQQTKYSIHCDTHEPGAILLLPDGAYQEDLRIYTNLKKYIAEHAENWYAYIKTDLGFPIDRDSLYFITGFTKAKTWGIASYGSTSPKEDIALEFRRPAPGHNAETTYIWGYMQGVGAGCSTSRAGPVLLPSLTAGGIIPENQCVFLRGIKVSLSEQAWDDILENRVHVPIGNDMSSEGENRTGAGIQRTSSTDSRNLTSNGASTTSSNMGSTSRPQERTQTDVFPAFSKLPHPSDIINEMLFREFPDARVAITHDREWSEVINDAGRPNIEEFIADVKDTFRAIRIGDYAVALISDDEEVDGSVYTLGRKTKQRRDVKTVNVGTWEWMRLVAKYRLDTSDVKWDTYAPWQSNSRDLVYEGLYHRQERVVVKVVRLKGMDGEEENHRSFQKQVMIHAEVHERDLGRHILPFYGFYEANTLRYLVSPWQGADVITFRRQNPNYNPLRLIKGIALGIQVLHTMEPPILHGNIRGGNILVDSRGTPLLSNFESSEIINNPDGIPSTNYRGGLELDACDFQAVEVWDDTLGVFISTKTDIYAFGITVREIITDEPLFHGMPRYDPTGCRTAFVIKKVSANEKPYRPSNIEDELWDFLTRCWSLNPLQRPSVGDILKLECMSEERTADL